ncbi:hypothetical protein LGN16_09715 [Burkholderia vietnamiensis]|nr:hypothetical protein [Burkholderia vietnamiensis]
MRARCSSTRSNCAWCGARTASHATRFDDGPSTCAARAPNLRVALLRAFVRARFGDEVDTPPAFAHRMERGMPVRHDVGVPIPSTDHDPATGESSDIRSIPRM